METENKLPISLNNFMETKEKEILAIAKKNTEETVKKEIALLDFELLLSANLSEREEKSLSEESRIIRKESWHELKEKFDGNYNRINEFLNDF